MANYRALAIDPAGLGNVEVRDTDVLQVGNITPVAGNLTLGGAAGSNVVVSAGQTLSVSGGTGGINLTGGADLLAAAGSTLQGFDSIEGILSTNLLDKSASETVSGQWTFAATSPAKTFTLIKASGGEVANDLLFQIQNSAGNNLFSVDLEGDVEITGGETVAGTTIYTGNVTLGDGGNTVQLGSAALPATGDNVYINTTGGTTDGSFSVTTANFNIDTAGIIDTNGNVIVINADAAGGTNEYSANVWLDGDGATDIEAWRVRDDGSTQSFAIQYKQNPTNPKNLAEVGWTSILTATPTGVNINGTLTATSISGPVTTDGTTAAVWGVNTDAAGATDEDSLIASAGGDGANVQAWRWFNDTTAKTFTLQYKQDPTDITDPTEVGWTPNAMRAYNTGVVDFPYNVNAQAGLDVTGAALTVDANGIDTLGNIDLNGTLSFDGVAASIIDTSGNNNLSITVGTGTLSATADLVDLRTNVKLLDIPAGSAALATGLSIGGTKITTANFTAPNVDILLNGSNADALHTHAAVDAGQVVVSGLTLTVSTQYYCYYVSGNNAATYTDASATGTFLTATFAGVHDTASADGTLVNAGKVEVQLVAGLVGPNPPAPAAGRPVFLSPASVGRLTTGIPTSGSNEYMTRVGIILDASTYGLNQRCTVLLQPDRPLLR